MKFIYYFRNVFNFLQLIENEVHVIRNFVALEDLSVMFGITMEQLQCQYWPIKYMCWCKLHVYVNKVSYELCHKSKGSFKELHQKCK